MSRFRVYRQLDQMDCGVACLKMVAAYYGKHFSFEDLRERCYITRQGSNLQGINDGAESIGLKTIGVNITFDQLDEKANLPCILHWNQNHYVVLPPQNYNRFNPKAKLIIADPGIGLVKVSRQTFLNSWLNKNDDKGIVLLLEPTQEFYDFAATSRKKKGLSLLLKYLRPFRKRYLPQLILGMILGNLLSLLFPFLTQALVDYGIAERNKSVVFLILISQLALFAGNSAIEIIRAWILLHMNTRINISIISDFLFKMMKLPIRFFETKLIGDIMQRVNDHKRIEQFLTSSSLNTVFSFISLITFLIVLGYYNHIIVLIFLAGTGLSLCFILFFLHRRSEIDYARFQAMSANQSNLVEIISGMQEIKLTDSETLFRWKWERIQAKVFHLNIKSLTLEQYQSIGTSFMTQLKNILISYTASILVINGRITLGEMLSISYIIGQLNSPIEQLLTFIRSVQDARLSLERLTEVQDHANEEKNGHDIPVSGQPPILNSCIRLQGVSFRYGGPDDQLVLEDINLAIPRGKITAIVGASGSGKTTLLKLLLKFYEPTAGSITLDNVPLDRLSPGWWRSQCGVVMQDGYIFSDTIAHNIAVSEDVDFGRLQQAIRVSNIFDFIDHLPKGTSTGIGPSGIGISAGQKQRILISRAVYKNPEFLLFDEATSALDANNEKVIIDNLNDFFQNRTVVVIAHRLSTVKHADQIIVLEGGKIVERGTHEELACRQGKYYQLIKNQLDLGR